MSIENHPGLKSSQRVHQAKFAPKTCGTAYRCRINSALRFHLHPLPALLRQVADVLHDGFGNRLDQRFVVRVAVEPERFADGDGLWPAQVPGDDVGFAFQRGWDAFAVFLVQGDAEPNDRDAGFKRQPGGRGIRRAG